MALKTTPTDQKPEDYFATVPPPRREEAFALLDLMRRVTGEPPMMWGDSIVGFGAYDYTYDSGHSGRWFLTGFAPRKAAMTVYIMPDLDRYADALARLGRHKRSVSCLYIPRLEKIDSAVLEEIVADSVKHMRARHGV